MKRIPTSLEHEGQRSRASRRQPISSAKPTRATLTPENILRLLQDKRLRMHDNPALAGLAHQLIVSGDDDPELVGEFIEEARHRAWQAATGDPFHAKYPSLAAPLDFDVPFMVLPDDRWFGLIFESLFRGTAFIGPTGRGKTSALIVLLAQLAAMACVIVIDRKREMRRLACLKGFEGKWRVLPWTSLAFALLQPPPGVGFEIWANEVVSMLARSYGQYASQRVLLDCVFKTRRVDGECANLDSLIKQVRAFVPEGGYREQGYKEACIWILLNLRQTAPCFRFGQSNMLELLMSEPGGTIIEVDSLPVQHLGFMAAYIHRWVYSWRLHSR